MSVDAARKAAEAIWEDAEVLDEFMSPVKVDDKTRGEVIEKWVEIIAAAYPGPTEKFPEGKLGEDDEGEIRLAVGNKDGNVILDFGKPVAWLALPPQNAVEVAERLVDRARRVATEPLVLRIPGGGGAEEKRIDLEAPRADRADQAEFHREQAGSPVPGAAAEPPGVPDADLPRAPEGDSGLLYGLLDSLKEYGEEFCALYSIETHEELKSRSEEFFHYIYGRMGSDQ